jgi:hypothetical protein
MKFSVEIADNTINIWKDCLLEQVQDIGTAMYPVMTDFVFKVPELE